MSFVRNYYRHSVSFTEDSPEGLIDRSVPAEEGAGSEEDEPQNGEAEINSVVTGDEVSQARQQVEEQSHTVD